jgi:hypothetical protein
LFKNILAKKGKELIKLLVCLGLGDQFNGFLVVFLYFLKRGKKSLKSLRSDMVVHILIPATPKVEIREDHGLRPAQAKSYRDPNLTNKLGVLTCTNGEA